MSKEKALLDLCLSEKAKHRKVLAYSVYTGKRHSVVSNLRGIIQLVG